MDFQDRIHSTLLRATKIHSLRPRPCKSAFKRPNLCRTERQTGGCGCSFFLSTDELCYLLCHSMCTEQLSLMLYKGSKNFANRLSLRLPSRHWITWKISFPARLLQKNRHHGKRRAERTRNMHAWKGWKRRPLVSTADQASEIKPETSASKKTHNASSLSLSSMLYLKQIAVYVCFPGNAHAWETAGKSQVCTTVAWIPIKQETFVHSQLRCSVIGGRSVITG